MNPIGNLLDTLGVEVDIRDGDLVSSAVVVMSVMTADESSPRLVIASSDGISWIEQVGLLRLAERISSDPTPDDEDE